MAGSGFLREMLRFGGVRCKARSSGDVEAFGIASSVFGSRGERCRAIDEVTD